MSDFLQTVACLVGRQVKVQIENPRNDGMSLSIRAMLEDVSLANQTIKLEDHDPIPAEDIYTVKIINPDFSKRADR